MERPQPILLHSWVRLSLLPNNWVRSAWTCRHTGCTYAETAGLSSPRCVLCDPLPVHSWQPLLSVNFLSPPSHHHPSACHLRGLWQTLNREKERRKYAEGFTHELSPELGKMLQYARWYLRLEMALLSRIFWKNVWVWMTVLRCSRE